MPINLMDFDPDAQAAPKAANPFTKPATDLMDFDPDAVEQAQPTPQPKQGTISSPRPIPDAMRTMAPRPGPVPDVMRGTVATPEQAPLNPPAPKQSIWEKGLEVQANLNSVPAQVAAGVVHGAARTFGNYQTASAARLAQRAEEAKQRGFEPAPLPPATIPAVYGPGGVLVSPEQPNPDYLTAISEEKESPIHSQKDYDRAVSMSNASKQSGIAIKDWQTMAEDYEDKLLKKIGAGKGTTGDATAKFIKGVGVVAAEAALTGELAPVAFLAQTHIDTTAAGIDQGLSPDKAAEKANYTTGALGAMMMIPGVGEMVKSPLKYAVVSTAKSIAEGVGWGLWGNYVEEKFGNNLTDEQKTKNVWDSVGFMLGMGLHGTVSGTMGRVNAQPSEALANSMRELDYGAKNAVKFAEENGITTPEALAADTPEAAKARELVDDAKATMEKIKATTEEAKNAVQEGQVQEGAGTERLGSDALSEANREVRQPEGAVQETPEVGTGGGVRPAGEALQKEVVKPSIVPASKAADIQSRVKEESNWAVQNRDAVIDDYLKQTNVISGDDFAERMLPSVAENPTEGHLHVAEHGGVNLLAADAYAKKLAEPPTFDKDGYQKPVLIMVGNAAVGKSGLAEKYSPSSHTVLDVNSADPQGLIDNINAARKAGHIVDIMYVHAPLEVAVHRNIVRQIKKGRPVPIKEQADMAASTVGSFKQAHDVFGGDDGSRFITIETTPEGKARGSLWGEDAITEVNRIREENGKSSLLKRATDAYNEYLGGSDALPTSAARAVFERGIREGSSPQAVQGREQVVGGGTRGVAEVTPPSEHGVKTSEEVAKPKPPNPFTPKQVVDLPRAETVKEPPSTPEAVPAKSRNPFEKNAEPKAAKAGEPVKAREERAQTVQEVLPGPENKDARAAAYKVVGKNPTPEDVAQAHMEQAGAVTPESILNDKNPELGALQIPAGQPGNHFLSRVTKQIVSGIVHTATEAGDFAKHIGENASLNLARALEKNNQLQHLHEEGKGLSPIADSIIDPTLPKPKGDITTNPFARFFVSQHHVESAAMPAAEGYVIDKSMADNDRVMKQASGTQWAVDVLKPVKDASRVVQHVMSSVAKNIFDVNSKLSPLTEARDKIQSDIDKANKRAVAKLTNEAEKKATDEVMRSEIPAPYKQEALERTMKKALEDVMDEAANDEVVIAAKNELAAFDKTNKANMDQLSKARTAHYADAKGRIVGLAKKYSDVRVALLSEAGEKPEQWLADISTKEDIETAKKVADGMQKYKEALEKRGIPTLDIPYLTHLIRPMDAGMFDTIEGQAQIKKLLAFHHRQPDSVNLFPSIHGALSYYIPTVARKLAYQPVVSKWSPNPYLKPESGMHAPKFGAWLNNEIREMEGPKKREVYESLVNAVKKFEILKTIALSPRVAVKHAVKCLNLIGYHHSWLLPGMKDTALLYAHKTENVPLIGKALRAMNGNTADTDLVQCLASNLMATKQIRRMLVEDPFVADYQHDILNKFTGEGVRGLKQPFLNLGKKIVTIAGYPVTAVEGFENALNMMTSIRRGTASGFDPAKNVRATMLNILDYNYRGGSDSAKYLKDNMMNTGFMFTMTPAKSLELHSKIVNRGLRGEKDVYGSDETAHLIRHMIVLGTAGLVAKHYGQDIWKDMVHSIGVSGSWAINMAKAMYHGTLSSAGVESSKGKGKKYLAKAMGNFQGPVSVSPVLGVANDIYALGASLQSGSLKPILKQVSAVKQAKAIFGKTPKGYAGKAEYLTDTPTEIEEKRREKMAQQKGNRMLKGLMR